MFSALELPRNHVALWKTVEKWMLVKMTMVQQTVTAVGSGPERDKKMN